MTQIWKGIFKDSFNTIEDTNWEFQMVLRPWPSLILKS